MRTDTQLNTCWHCSDPQKSAHPRQHILAAAGPRSCLLNRQSQHGRAPGHRHRLGYPISSHGTSYLTLLWQSRAPACAPTPPHGCAPWHWHRLSHGSPLRHLSHPSLAVARSGVGCHPPTRQARALALAATPPSRWPRAPAFAATHLVDGLALW